MTILPSGNVWESAQLPPVVFYIFERTIQEVVVKHYYILQVKQVVDHRLTNTVLPLNFKLNGYKWKFFENRKIIGTVYNSGGGGALRFFTAASGGASGGYSVNSPVERMMIDRNGNVGIGVKSPLCTLNTHNILSSSHNTLPNDGSACLTQQVSFWGKVQALLKIIGV